MNSLIPMLGAIMLLLLTPGPTNTLIALAGAERGWRGALPLILAEICGYLLVVAPLALAGQALLTGLPPARAAITFGAALWVVWLAVRMWRLPQPGAARTRSAVDGRAVLVTTMLNPKALIFGLALLPAPDIGRLVLNLAAFVAAIILVAAVWAGLGAALARGRNGALPGWARRAAALWLAALALWLAAKGAGIAA